MELKLQPELKLGEQQESSASMNLYTIVAGSPILEGREVKLYLSPSNFSDVIAYAAAPNLDEAVEALFDHTLHVRLDGGESTRPDFLGWPAYFTSFGFVQAGGNDFFGYEPFIAYPVPQEALLKFAQFYTNRVTEALKENSKSPF